MSGAIGKVLKDAAQRIEKAIADAGKAVRKHFDDTGTGLRKSAEAHVEHDAKAAKDLEGAAKHRTEDVVPRGGSGEPSVVKAGGGAGPSAGSDLAKVKDYGKQVDDGLAAKLKDPRTAGHFPPGYDPRHGLTTEEYLAKYSDGTFTKYGHPNWKWDDEAPGNGFVASSRRPGGPKVNSVVDRYGEPYGRFLSPVDTPYPQRGLPIENLTQPYHRYRVLKEFPPGHEQGLIADAFGEPGKGLQYFNKDHNVQWLIDNHYIKEI